MIISIIKYGFYNKSFFKRREKMKHEELKALKDKSGLTAQQIADKSNVPLPTVNRILSGQTQDPGYETLTAIINAMSPEEPAKPDDHERLVAVYERTIIQKNKFIKALGIICLVFCAVFIFLLIWDLFNPSIGFVNRK